MGIIPSHARGKALTDSLAACTRHPIGTASKIPPWSEKATTEKEARSIPARLDCQTSCRCAEEKKKTYVTATFKGLPGKADVLIRRLTKNREIWQPGIGVAAVPVL